MSLGVEEKEGGEEGFAVGGNVDLHWHIARVKDRQMNR